MNREGMSCLLFALYFANSKLAKVDMCIAIIMNDGLRNSSYVLIIICGCTSSRHHHHRRHRLLSAHLTLMVHYVCTRAL